MPKKKRKRERVRARITFSPEASKTFEEIKELADITSDHKIIRTALHMYAWYLKEKKAGNRLMLVDKDDQQGREVDLDL